MNALSAVTMTRRPLLAAALAASALLAACNPASRDQITRDAARAAIRPVLEQRFPGVPLEPALDCVIQNANSTELLALAADAVTGPTASTAEIVTTIIARPGTVQCLARDGLRPFLR